MIIRRKLLIYIAEWVVGHLVVPWQELKLSPHTSGGRGEANKTHNINFSTSNNNIDIRLMEPRRTETSYAQIYQ